MTGEAEAAGHKTGGQGTEDAVWENSMAEKQQDQATLTGRVNEVIEQIRPHIQADGGDIELIGIDHDCGKVSIRFLGACRGCPMSAMTLKMGVERHIKEQISEVSEVVSVE